MNRKIYKWCAPLLAAAALSACGGGGGGGSYYPPPAGAGGTTPPPTASNPYDTFVNYVMGLVKTTLDSAEPADVTAYDPPPTSDTAEPISTQ